MSQKNFCALCAFLIILVGVLNFQKLPSFVDNLLLLKSLVYALHNNDDICLYASTTVYLDSVVKNKLHGIINQKCGYYETSIMQLEKANSLKMEDSFIALFLGISYLKYDQTDTAINIFRDYQLENYFLILGKQFQSMNYFEIADLYYSIAAKLLPESAEVYYKLAELHRATGNFEKSRKYAVESIKRDDKNTCESDDLQGQLLIDQGDWKSAIPYYEQAVVKCPHNAVFQYKLGSVYWEGLGDFEKATEAYSKSIKLSNDYLSPVLGLVKIYLSRKQIDYAKAIFLDFIEKNPDNCLALNRAREFFLNIGDPTTTNEISSQIFLFCVDQ